MSALPINADSRGVFVIAVTPFRPDGAIDFASIDSVVEFYIERGVSGMTIMGMMGEAPKLSATESVEVMTRYLERVDGRVPVVVGVSNAGLDNLAALSSQAMDHGAAGVMVAPTPGLTTEQALYRYFESVFTALGPDVPVCYQDYPQSTGVPISVPTLGGLVDDFDQLVMFKHEDCPGLAKLSELRRAESEGRRRVSVLVGNGGLYLPLEMARGADGAMTGFAYPEMLVQVVDLFLDGRHDDGEELFDAYLPLVRYEQQPGLGLAARKTTLARRGAIAHADTRRPGPALGPIESIELDRLMRRLERRLAEGGST